MNDSVWVILRAVLMVGGGFFAGKGYVSMADVSSLADTIKEAWPGIVAVGGAAWAIFVRWNTRAVPINTAMRADVPTINPATGAHEPGDTFKS